ncbi:hypothetical protein IAT38_007206 [Cryptococcus sp. DSM 104549]
MLALLSLAEVRSEHHLGLAVAAHGREVLSAAGLSPPNGEVVEFESYTGEGLEAVVHLSGGGIQERIRIGKSSFCLASSDGKSAEAFGASSGAMPANILAFEAHQMSHARTVIFVSIIRSSSSTPIPVVALALSDSPKPSSAQAIHALRAMGIKVTLLTGDAEITARAVAREVGIDEDEVYAGVSPKGKAKIVADLGNSTKGGGVAMVGDGINDSPALVSASLGIALSSGTSTAIEAADVVFMRSDLLDVVAALDLGQVIFRKIKANLLWACCYNVLMIPLAMGVLLPCGIHLRPMMAAAAMAFSSVSVVASSLTLKWWTRPKSPILAGEVYHAGGARKGVASLYQDGRDAVLNAAESVFSKVTSAVPFLGKLGGWRGSAISTAEYEAIPLDRAGTPRV